MTGDSHGEIHPELAKLQQDYLQLYNDVNSGAVTPEQAQQVLANLTSLDGDGALWSIDPNTGRLQRAMPGQPPQPAEPHQFAPSRLPAPPTPTPPPHGTPAHQVPANLDPPLHPVPKPPLSTKLRSSGQQLLTRSSAAVRPLAGRGRTLLVVALLVVLFAAVWLTRPDGAGTTADDAGAEETAQLGDSGTADDDADAEETAQLDDSGTADDDAEIFGLAQAELLAEDIAAGDRTAVAGWFTFDDDPQLRADASQLLGVYRSGMALHADDPQEVGTGEYQMRVEASHDDLDDDYRWMLTVVAIDDYWYVTDVDAL